MKKNTSDVELYLLAGMSGTGKTQYVIDSLDYTRPIMALDFRGQVAEKLNRQPIQTRKAFFAELNNCDHVALVIYQPGMEDFDIEDDIDFFLTMALCTTGMQIFIDEIDFELKPTEYPASFRQLIASARTQQLTIYVTAHRLKECPLKLRALGKKIIFRIEEESDLDYLKGLPGFNAEQIKHLPDYHSVTLPIRKTQIEPLPIDK